MAQIDGPRRHVYINFVDSNLMQNVLQTMKRQAEYRQDTGEISTVRIEVAGWAQCELESQPPHIRSTYAIPHKFGSGCVILHH